MQEQEDYEANGRRS